MAYSNWGARVRLDGKAVHDNCDTTVQRVLEKQHNTDIWTHIIGKEEQPGNKTTNLYHAVVGDVQSGITNPELSLETLMPLLQEEYSEEAIEKSEIRIQKALQQVNSEVNFRHQVAQEYLDMAVNYRTHPKDVLRQMGKIFPKGLMGRVYAELEKIG